jgi:CRISPR-associated protein Cmr1
MITPLFLAGADGWTPELRPPSIRGGLRFWLRALLGGTIGDDLSSIKQTEAAVFGNTDAASAAVIRVSPSGELRCSRYRPLLHSSSRTFVFEGWDPDQFFTLYMSTRAGVPTLPDSAAASLLLMVSLGGLGRRSRRGFGSLQIKGSKIGEGLGLSPQAQELLSPDLENDENLVAYLRQLMTWAPTTIAHPSPPAPWSGDPSFSILSPDYARVMVCCYPFASWEQAMRDFWGKLRSSPYRDNPVFGLPIRGRGRRASPLLLKIWRLGGRYYLVLTAFRAQLMPNQQGNWTLMARFLDDCKHEWSGSYVLKGTVPW